MSRANDRSVGYRGRGGRTSPHTSDSVLPIAVGVFIERGYDGTSMEHLSQALGIGKSSIYHHVSSKEELLRLALERALTQLFAVLDEPAARAERARDRLHHVLCRTTEVLLAELPYVALLLRVRGNTDTERWALQRRREFDRCVTELLREAATDGDVRTDIEPRLATRLLFGMVNSIVEWHQPRTEGSDAEIVKAVVGLAFRGLLGDPSRDVAEPRLPDAPSGPTSSDSLAPADAASLDGRHGAT